MRRGQGSKLGNRYLHAPVLAASGAALMLAGCSSAFDIPQASFSLPACEVERVSVLDLHESGGCNLEGALIELPDGTTVSEPVVEIGVTAVVGHGPVLTHGPTSEVLHINMGTLGTLVVLREAEGVTVWGTEAGVEAYLDGYQARRHF